MSVSLNTPSGVSMDVPPRKSYARLPEIVGVPDLIEVQKDSFHWFVEEGLRERFTEVFPIEDFTGTRLQLHFVDYEFRKPKYEVDECRQRDATYAKPLFVKLRLEIKETGEIKETDIFFGDLPWMTDVGTFVINGVERVVVNQLVRSPGVYFTVEEDATSGRDLCFAKLIPDRGAWLEFETSNKNIVSVKVDGKRKIPITTLLRAIGYSSDDELLKLFTEDASSEHSFIRSTLEREPQIGNQEDALIDVYRRLRPGEPPNRDNAVALINNLFFNPRRYDLGKVGRFQLNKRLKLDLPLSQRVLTREDLVEIVRHIILVNNKQDKADDIDHLGNRRVRTVGELIQNQFRIGLLRLERVVKERMSIIDPVNATPNALINTRPVVASMREFFGGSQLSQFMDQTNPLAEITHKRRLSALGPGGLSRERAGFDVRDVHHSHYGRICPIETPEGPNIGLIGSLATYARVNEYSFIETPYRLVRAEIDNKSGDLVGRMAREDIKDSKGHAIVKARAVIEAEAAARLSKLSQRQISVAPYVTDEIEFLSADKEEEFTIAQASAPLDAKNQFVQEKIEVRRGSRYFQEAPSQIQLMDVSPKQVVSVATALIPFLEHNDANRALMGANMQRQAVPLLRPEAPLVATGMEFKVAQDSGQVIFAEAEGEITSVSGSKVALQKTYRLAKGQAPAVAVGDKVEKNKTLLAVGSPKEDALRPEFDGKVVSISDNEIVVEKVYSLQKFVRTNQGTCINQRPQVMRGDHVTKGHVLADSSATDHGEVALGQNVLCAFMSWEGYNFEDAIVLSERMVRDDIFTSVHIEKHELEARDTKLGPEEITRDIPNVAEESLRDLDETGIIRVGAEVGPGDILVGKITPKGETELTAEEKLLRAIFGEKARDVKDSSLRVPHGEQGKVIDVRVFSRENHDELPAGVNQMVRVWIAQKRKISVGDKMAGRHGNKGVIARVLPEQDMPFLPDGRPVDIILNPIGVPSRMNLGQVLETHIGWAGRTLGFDVLSPVFDGASGEAIEDALCRAWLAQQAGAVSHDPDARQPFNKELAKEWLAKQGYDADQVFEKETLGVAKSVALRIWLKEQGEDMTGLDDQAIETKARELHVAGGQAPPIFGKMTLHDGRTGEPFDQSVTVGYIYMMKLIHLVEDKIHARSTGPYSLITQQPLGGKAQFGGQRFGEMEVWALEAYGAAYNLQELLTVKSDDVAGRAKTYEAIIKGEDILQPSVPESFKVLVKELQSLGLAVEVLNEEEEKVQFLEEEPAPRRLPHKMGGLQ